MNINIARVGLVSGHSWLIYGLWKIDIYDFTWLSKYTLYHVDSHESETDDNVSNLVNSARRKLLDQSSNLAAAPFSGPAIQISSIPFTQSSGAFPAVPHNNKKQYQSPAPLPSPSNSPHMNQTNQQNSANGASGKLWKDIITIAGVTVLVIVLLIMLCIWRKRAAKVIKPWKTGISGQLQKAFITGNILFLTKIYSYMIELQIGTYNLEQSGTCTWTIMSWWGFLLKN